jgi:uncharacterized protein YceH (UPF0502 family)
MASEQITQRDGSFVVRIWWEPGTSQARHWHGWVQHVRNGEQSSFQTLAELIAFIEQETGMQASAEGLPQGLR